MNINKNTWLCSLLLAACAQTSQAQVQVTKTNDQITIGNAYLSRTFHIANGRLTPGKLTNKRAGGIVFTPSAGSEEFALNPQKRDYTPLNRQKWTAEADSWCVESDMVGNPSLAIDGDNGTMWHTWYATPKEGGKKVTTSCHTTLSSLWVKRASSVALATCPALAHTVLCRMATSRATSSISLTIKKMDACQKRRTQIHQRRNHLGGARQRV